MKEKIRELAKKRLFYAILAIIFVFAVLSTVVVYYFDPDDYWILAVGRQIVETKQLPHVNSMTVVPNMHLTVQQWAWDVITYAGYAAFGNFGLLFITLANILLCVFLLGRYMKPMQMDKTTKAIAVLLFVFLLRDFFCCRPNILSINLLLWQMICQERYTESGNWKHLMPLVPITILEANFHASMWFFHLLFLLPLFFPAINTFVADFRKRQYSVKYPIIVAALMTASAFLNPYGFENVAYVFRSYGSELKNFGVMEMENIPLLSVEAMLLLGCVITYIVVYKAGTKKQISPERFYLMAGCLVLGSMCYRNSVFSVLAILILLRDAASEVDFTEFHDYVNKQHISVLILAVAAMLYSVYNCAVAGFCVERDDVITPVSAVEYLNENAEPGARVYTTYNTGAYFEWHGYTVYIDARAEIYLKKVNGSADVLKEYKKLQDDPTLSDYKELQNKYNFDYYWVETGSHMDNFLECDVEYEVVLEREDMYRLYARSEEVSE